MCRFKSYVVTKDLKIHGSYKTGSHEKILAENGIPEFMSCQEALLTREYVCIEVTPKNLLQMTRDLADWVYTEDEKDSLPEWYRRNKARIEEAVFLQLGKDLQIQLALGNEEHKVTDTEIYAFDQSQVNAYGSSKVDAYGSSQVYTYSSSKVYAYDSSQIYASGSSQVVAYDSSQVDAYGSSQVVAYGSSRVDAYDSSQVNAYGSSKVDAYGSNQVRAYGSSKVDAYGSSQVHAYDASQVKIKSKTAIVSCKDKIFINKQATVVVQNEVNAAEA